MVRKVLKVLIAEPHGFCVGVKRAVDILSKAVDEFGNEFGMIYCLHELVHNPFVVDDFRRKGVVFVESIEEVPDKSVVVFSAHGVSPKVRKRAEEKNLKVVDATCPLVELVHKKVRDYHARGFSIIYVGKKGHVEVEGVLGESPLFVVSSVEDVDGLQVGDGFGSKGVVCLTQTTLSVDDTAEIIQKLKQRFPDIVLDGGICNATQERQDAVKKLAKKCDLILVLGAKNSSNSNRLVEAAKSQGVDAHLILDKSKLDRDWLKDVDIVGITSGASCPEFLFDELVEDLESGL
ncbi:MAG TPA: 4-hydroxy-3-methylbut-2-enyl diphosphate reductase [Candidatus Woesearchaeota archaeon]|nr:4-hydroxy-3-methylbut-2-enyl diphosphate reductase [Candidatus Woesearchaeota archaeon]